MTSFLIYGATGYTGTLAAEHAVERGLSPILAARSEGKVRLLAERLGLAWRAFDLADPARLRAGLEGVGAVLHAAGPFSATSRPMADACLAAHVHYLDITGEIDVFEALAARDGEAKDAGIMLLPGSGFDVVPTDCLAAHVAARLPGATRLRLSIGGFSRISRGTAKTMLEGAAYGTRVRQGGRLVELDGATSVTIDFGNGPQYAVAMPWGDVSTAWHSTGIPDIAVYFQTSAILGKLAGLPDLFGRSLIARPASQRLLKSQIERWLPPGPSPAQRARARHLFLGEVWDGEGRRAASRLSTCEGYTLTAMTAVECARRAASGEAVPGFQTPSKAFGADFVMGFDGTTRTDL